ncbi:TPA: hypothetical protein SLP15_004737 [Klebsiella aerogenes]|nr:hypothetical protein [Klebsiella aerogenes]
MSLMENKNIAMTSALLMPVKTFAEAFRASIGVQPPQDSLNENVGNYLSSHLNKTSKIVAEYLIVHPNHQVVGDKPRHLQRTSLQKVMFQEAMRYSALLLNQIPHRYGLLIQKLHWSCSLTINVPIVVK